MAFEAPAPALGQGTRTWRPPWRRQLASRPRLGTCYPVPRAGVDRLVVLSGVCEAAPGETIPYWVADSTRTLSRDILRWQWEERLIPYWREHGKIAEDHGCSLAVEPTLGELVHSPDTLMACWIAMSNTGPDNGGLCVVPGSHLDGLRTTHRSSGDEHHNWNSEHLMRDRAGKQWTQEFYSFKIDDIAPD